MKNYILISQFSPPDSTAVGQQVYDLANEISNKNKVILISGNSDYNNIKTKYNSKKINKNFFIKRLPIFNFGKKNFFTRILGQLSFIIIAFFYIMQILNKQSILILTSSPSISSLLYFFLSIFKKKNKNYLLGF